MNSFFEIPELTGYGRFHHDLAAGQLPAAVNTMRRFDRAADREAVMKARRPFAVAEELAATLLFEHRRMGAGPASLAAIERLAAGGARVVLTGQQPGLFGGPIYTRFKIATAVALARRLSAELGESVVPVYWNAADDADFDEAARGTLAGPDLRLLRFALPGEARVARGWIGDVPAAVLEAVMDQVPESARESARGSTWREWRSRMRDVGGDFGRLHGAAAMMGFEVDGLVVVDARWPELRRASAALFGRYLERADEVAAALGRSARLFEEAGYDPPLGAGQGESALFVTPERARLRLDAEEARREAARLLPTHPGHLSPNVVLRPLVCDTVFPTVAHVTGPSETQYMAQLHEVYRMLQVERPLVVNRLAGTLRPAAGRRVAGESREALLELVNEPVERLRRWFEERLPGDLSGAVEEARRRVGALYDELREPARRLDNSLTQILDSAREKSLFQLERLPEGAAKKVRQKEEAACPGLAGLADFLAPRARLQERELSALNFDLFLGDAAPARLAGLADDHLEALMSGRRRHYIVDV